MTGARQKTRNLVFTFFLSNGNEVFEFLSTQNWFFEFFLSAHQFRLRTSNNRTILFAETREDGVPEYLTDWQGCIFEQSNRQIYQTNDIHTISFHKKQLKKNTSHFIKICLLHVAFVSWIFFVTQLRLALLLHTCNIVSLGRKRGEIQAFSPFCNL